MIKLRLWGESAEIERMIETVCNITPQVRVLSVSKPYKDRGASVYQRCYMDIEVHEVVTTATDETKIKQIADRLATEKSEWKVCDFDDEYYVNLLPSAERLYAAEFGDIRQAVRAFAEELKQAIKNDQEADREACGKSAFKEGFYNALYNLIDEKIQEL